MVNIPTVGTGGTAGAAPNCWLVLVVVGMVRSGHNLVLLYQQPATHDGTAAV